METVGAVWRHTFGGAGWRHTFGGAGWRQLGAIIWMMAPNCHFFLAFKYISIRRQLGDHILGGGCLARLETVGAGRRQFDPVGDSSSQLEPVGDSSSQLETTSLEVPVGYCSSQL